MTEKIAVNVRTQEEYDELMDIYEKKGWSFMWKQKPKGESYWYMHEEDTCITYCDAFHLSRSSFHEEKGYRVITLSELKQMEQDIIWNQNWVAIDDLVHRRDESPLPRYVYVSSDSAEYALKSKNKRLLIAILPGNTSHKYICVDNWLEYNYRNWAEYACMAYKYIAETPKVPEQKTITLKAEDWQTLTISEEKAKELGFTIKE